MTDLPYGLWRRIAPRAELDPLERRQRDADEAWDLRHTEEADRLDALVGRTVTLRRRMEAFPDPDTGEGRIYSKGCQFKVRGRVRDQLIVDLIGGELDVPMLLRADWIKEMP